ncbi:MAG: hypothetical protein IM547_01535 [Chitinophagaceae bacterium]|nr:hypothetical protein [Chitinophagaceae bacterium]
MDKTILYLDFETKDRGLSAGLGPGWPYKGFLDVIGYSYSLDGKTPKWSTNIDLLHALVESCDVLVAHNAAYELGVLEYLGVKYVDKKIVDTLLLAKLYNNQRFTYSLDSLGIDYLGDRKTNDKLANKARELKLVKSKAQDAVKYAKANLDVLYKHCPEVVIEYANHDVNLLIKLYNFLDDKVPDSIFKNLLSDLQKAVTGIRKRGVLVDTTLLQSSEVKLSQELDVALRRLREFIGDENPNSTATLVKVLDQHGIPYPMTDKGNPSITAKWVEGQHGEFFESLQLYRKLNKLHNDFVIKIKTMISAAYGKAASEPGNIVRIHPELNVMGATATGRFSSSNFNMQQLPKRDPYAKPLVRGFIIPEAGCDFYCLDFSAQEPRLQVHYADMIGSSGGKELSKRWSANPNFDMHSEVAKICGIDRTPAKIINLGLSYGMSSTKLAKTLKLSDKEARILIDTYHKKAPYLKDLTEACKAQLRKNGGIRSLLGRKITKPDDFYDEDTGRVQDFLYKGINMLIQGSAADQTVAAIVEAYRAGIPLGYPIHDELTASLDSELTAVKLQYIMENCVRLRVPSKSEITKGPTFAAQEELVPTLSEKDTLEVEKFKMEYTPLVDFTR